MLDEEGGEASMSPLEGQKAVKRVGTGSSSGRRDAPQVVPAIQLSAGSFTMDEEDEEKKVASLEWGPPNTLKQDRKALQAMAELEGPVDFEYKIPPGATWSEVSGCSCRETRTDWLLVDWWSETASVVVRPEYRE